MYRIYIAGGIDGYGECKDTVWSFDPITSHWRTHPPLIRPRAQLGMAALDGRLYVVGGLDWSAGHIRQTGGPVCLNSVRVPKRQGPSMISMMSYVKSPQNDL